MAANSDEVRRLLDTLSDEQVTRFVENVASNLPKYGLDKPVLQLTFSSFATENTAETKAGERPFLTIAFGRVEGGNIYARIGDEPFVLAVRASLLDNIYTDPLQWQSLVIYDFKPEQVHRLTVKADKEQALMRGPNKTWKFADGSAQVDQTNIQSLLNTLTKLRAVRWAGAPGPQHGFDKPLMTLTFTTSDDDKVAQKLVVGASAGTGLWFARADGREGTFVINSPDFAALKLPLVQKSIPAPSAVGSPADTGLKLQVTPSASPAAALAPTP
jgi:hypothetical protein